MHPRSIKSIGHIHNPNGHDEDDCDDGPSLIPRAFAESLAMRMAYLTAIQGNVFNGLASRSADKILKHSLKMLVVANILPAAPKAVRMVKSTHRRLGLDPNEYIIQKAICNICRKVYLPEVFKALSSPSCTVAHCQGLVYVEKEDGKGEIKRTPSKILPIVSLICKLRKMFLCPGFTESLRDSHKDISNCNEDSYFWMEDIHHGSIWHNFHVGIAHEVGTDGSVCNVHAGEGA